MDLGDLIFLILMGLGFLSSLGGAARKKNRKKGTSGSQRQTTPQRRPEATASARTAEKSSRKSRLQEARNRVRSQMEELLRELERGPEPEPAPAPLPKPRPKPRIPTAAEGRLEMATPEPETVFPDEIVVRDGTLHQKFHDKYISPISEPTRRSSRPRGRRFLRRETLKEAVLLNEILGPPKSLQ